MCCLYKKGSLTTKIEKTLMRETWRDRGLIEFVNAKGKKREKYKRGFCCFNRG